MPRKKKELEPEDPEPGEPKGEALSAMEDFVRKLSNVFSSDPRTPEAVPVIEDDSDNEDTETDQEG